MTTLTATNRAIRRALKDALPACKFSVRGKRASMMTETTISLMAAPWAAVEAESPYWDGGHVQLNHFQLQGDMPDSRICNGVHLTLQCWQALARAVAIAHAVEPRFGQGYRFLTVQIGKYDKSFKII